MGIPGNKNPPGRVDLNCHKNGLSGRPEATRQLGNLLTGGFLPGGGYPVSTVWPSFTKRGCEIPSLKGVMSFVWNVNGNTELLVRFALGS